MRPDASFTVMPGMRRSATAFISNFVAPYLMGANTTRFSETRRSMSRAKSLRASVRSTDTGMGSSSPRLNGNGSNRGPEEIFLSVARGSNAGTYGESMNEMSSRGQSSEPREHRS